MTKTSLLKSLLWNTLNSKYTNYYYILNKLTEQIHKIVNSEGLEHWNKCFEMIFNHNKCLKGMGIEIKAC